MNKIVIYNLQIFSGFKDVLNSLWMDNLELVFVSLLQVCLAISVICKTVAFKGGGGGGGGGARSVKIDPSRQLLDDCSHKRNSKRKVDKPI